MLFIITYTIKNKSITHVGKWTSE